MKNKHTTEFYLKKYNEIKEFAEEKNIQFPYKSVREFQSDWNAIRADGVKNVDRAIKYSLQYETDYKTALSEYRALKDNGVENIKLKSLKEMKTKEFAEQYKDKLIEMYHTKRAEGLTGDQAGAFISTYWFGSE